MFVKLGRSVRYRKSDLVAWINSREMTYTTARPNFANFARLRT